VERTILDESVSSTRVQRGAFLDTRIRDARRDICPSPQFLFASPFFIAFFILSITAGLPFLAWLRLSSLADVDDEAPYRGRARTSRLDERRDVVLPRRRASRGDTSSTSVERQPTACVSSSGTTSRASCPRPRACRAPRHLNGEFLDARRGETESIGRDAAGVLPRRPSLPTIPRIRDIEVPDAVAEKAGVRKGAKASTFIDMLPWNEPGQLK